MAYKNLTEQIIELEWPMFESVNGDDKVSCQTNPGMFHAMRASQFDNWSDEAKASYVNDLVSARENRRNLLRDKYIYMMESTAPDEYELLKSTAQPVSAEKEEIVEKIWQIILEQTIPMRKKYPLISGYGRPLYSSEEKNGATSVETYQKSELKTYSLGTLKLLLKHIEELKAQGIEYAFKVQEASVMSNGYSSMDDAEAKLREWAQQILNGGGFPGDPPMQGH